MSARACRNVLRLVSELHVRGYQRIRIAPGMSPSGMHWRCSIAPATNIDPGRGVDLVSWERLAAHYSSAAGTGYFDWPGATRATPSRLADLFLQRFPEIAAEGRGSDWAYAGWYLEMLHLTYPDALPIAYADWELPLERLGTVNGAITIPLPPRP